MVHQPIHPREKQSRIETALQEYLERIDRGEAIDKSQFLAKYSDVAEDVQSFISNAEEMSRWAQGEQAADSTRSEARRASQTVHPSPTSVKKVNFDALPVDLDRYHVQELLGRGAMGAVYLAVDRQLDRRVAFKVPGFDAEESAELLVRFYHEARAAAHLQHPNICPVYDVGRIDGQHYIAMAYINGKTLAHHIKSDTPPNERQSLTIIRKLALALHEAHRQGVIHRDLKPANVMIDRRGEPIVMDFGLACRVESEGTARLTHEGVLIGSPAYMSPEQVEGNPERVTPATDQYSLGVILYELLTGQLPFRGSLTVVIAQVMQKAPTPPHEIRAEIDPRAEAVCLKMMSKSAADRYPTMEAVATAILKILREPKSESQDTRPATAAGVTLISSNVERQKLIETLLQEGDIAGAKELLEPMAALKEARSQKVARWAKQLLDQLKRDAQHWKETLPQLASQARAHLEHYEYSEAVKLLESIPAFYRSKEVAELLDDSTSKQAVLELLRADLVKAIRKNQPRELAGLVKQYLKLNPSHRGIKQLAAEVKQVGPERAIQVRRGRKDVLAPVIAWNRPRHFLIAAGFAIAAIAFTIILLPTSRGTVILEVHDPNVTLTFGDDEITVTKSGTRYQLKPTERRTLQVKIEGVLLDATTQEITVAKNETKLITARLLPDDQVELTVAGEAKTFAATSVASAIGRTPAASVLSARRPVSLSPVASTPSGLPSVAAVPFDAVSARSLQQEWATALGLPVEFTNSIGMRFRLIPPGEFDMGLKASDGAVAAYLDIQTSRSRGGDGTATPPTDALKHRVTLTRPYYVSVTETTREQYETVMSASASLSTSGTNKSSNRESVRYPIESVSWEDAIKFCNRLSTLEQLAQAYTGHNLNSLHQQAYRLPTEAEWEFACRAGTLTQLWNGDDPKLADHIAWHSENSGWSYHAVATTLANPFGLYDMTGNVSEWCQDWHQAYTTTSQVDPQGPPTGKERVLRGGSWFEGRSRLFSGFRYKADSTNSGRTGRDIGFRVVLPVGANASLPVITSAKISGSPVATLPESPGLPLRWLSCSIHVPSAFEQAAKVSNLIQDRSWPQHGDAVIQQARQRGVQLLLAFEPSDFPEFLTSDQPAFEKTLFELVRKNRDVVVGVNLLAPYTDSDRRGIGRIGPFGRRLKADFPELSFWVAYLETPKNWKGELPPIPPEVDVVELAFLNADTAESVANKFEQNLSIWQQLAGTRPLLARWVSSPSLEGTPKKGPLITESGTIAQCLRLTTQHGLAGVAFSHFGSRPESWAPSIDTDPHALRELQDFSERFGYAGPQTSGESPASKAHLPAQTPVISAPPNTGTLSGTSGEATVKKRAKLPTGTGLPVKWLAFAVHDPKSFEAAAEIANLILDHSWQRHGDTLIQQARPQGMTVILEFSRKEWLDHLAAKTPDFEKRLFELIRQNRDVVAGVRFVHPYTTEDRAAIDQVSVIGKKLKQEFPGLTYWVSYIEMPYGWKGPLLPIPPEVDVIDMAIYTDMTPEAVQSKIDKYLSTWRRLAGSRPVALHWDTWTPYDSRKPSNPLRTAPGTLTRCCQLSIQKKLAGVVINHYGPGEDTSSNPAASPAVESDPIAIGELRDFSNHYGFGRRDKR